MEARSFLTRASLLCALPVLLAGCLDERLGTTPTESGPDGKRDAPRGASVDGGMVSPLRLASTPSGRLLVSDSRRNMVFIVDPATLEPTGAFHVDGKPLAVGMWGGLIYVGNATRHRVDVFDPSGRYRYSVGTGLVGHPADLAIDSVLGLVFVLDGAAPDVKVFTRRGTLQRTITGALEAPTGIALDLVRGEVLVSDYGAPGNGAAVKIFDYGGNLVTEISGRGTCGMLGCSNGFSRPQGLVVGHNGRVYVADALLAQVLVFDRETGQQAKALGGRDVGPPYLRVPLDVVFGKNGHLFVTSNVTARVEVFARDALQ